MRWWGAARRRRRRRLGVTRFSALPAVPRQEEARWYCYPVAWRHCLRRADSAGVPTYLSTCLPGRLPPGALHGRRRRHAAGGLVSQVRERAGGEGAIRSAHAAPAAPALTSRRQKGVPSLPKCGQHPCPLPCPGRGCPQACPRRPVGRVDAAGSTRPCCCDGTEGSSPRTLSCGIIEDISHTQQKKRKGEGSPPLNPLLGPALGLPPRVCLYGGFVAGCCCSRGGMTGRGLHCLRFQAASLMPLVPRSFPRKAARYTLPV